jgi:hypothetical protein
MAVENLIEFPLNRVVEIATVSHDCQPALWTEHSVDLGQGSVGPEPLERLRDNDRVGRRGRQRDRIRSSGEHVDAVARDQLSHRAHRLDRDDVRSRPDEQPRKLAGSCRQVHDRGAGSKTKAVDEVRDGRPRIGRTGALVGVRAATETLLRPGMDAHTPMADRTANLQTCSAFLPPEAGRRV